MKTELMNDMNAKILTKPGYWNSIPEAVKSMWQNTANQIGNRWITCTHRPLLSSFSKGGNKIRRCSTGGRWGKSADVVGMNLQELLADGYVFVTYTPRAEAIAEKCEMIYSNDAH